MFSTCNVGGMNYLKRKEMQEKFKARQVQAVAFDFDGVLADSVTIKDEAFRSLVTEATPEHRSLADAVWYRTKGMYRPDRIALVFEEALGVVLSETELEQKVATFKQRVFEQTVNAPWIAGAEAYLKGWPLIPSYVVSAGPQEEVQEILRQRDMKRYFRAIHGGPVQKKVHLAAVIEREECRPEELLFLGDSRADHTAAVAVGASFLGVVGPGVKNPFPDTVSVVENLLGLKERVATWWD